MSSCPFGYIDLSREDIDVSREVGLASKAREHGK